MAGPRNFRDQDDGASDNDEHVKTLVGHAPASEFAFDFGAFERSEAEAQDAHKPEPTVPFERPIERRPIIPRTWLSPGDSVVETRPVGNMTVVSLRGKINESFRGIDLGQSLSGVVVFDLSQVDRISSFGVKGWLQMLEHARFTACYFFRCSEAVINQITMMRNFCGPGLIHSLLVPYVCDVCGEEFSAVFEAVADREVILGRSPAAVECSRCTGPAKIADDPWAYLAVDDHLLDHVPADLEQVLEHLTQAQRVDPIEKFVSDDETRIRINAPLDARLRLGRALAGLEGRVVFDLTPKPDVSAQGARRLLDAIRELEADVTEVWIDGASKPLIDALLEDPPPRTFVSTAWVTAVAPETGIRRPVLINLKKKRAALLRGEMPAVDAAWARGAVKFEDGSGVFTAARLLVPQHVSHATPTPAPMAMAPPAWGTSAPSGPPSMYHSGLHSVSGMHSAMHRGVGTPHSTGMRPAEYAPAPSRAAGSMLVWQVAAFTGMTLLLAAVAFTLVFLLAYFAFQSSFDGVPSPIAAALPTAAEGWSEGGALPPAWSEQPFSVDGSGLKGSGIGRGETAESAAEGSRLLAIYNAVGYFAGVLANEPVSSIVGENPGEDQAPMVVERFLADVGSWVVPQRVNQSVKREVSGFSVATQHSIDNEAAERVLVFYRQTGSFRGVIVGRAFPYRDSANHAIVIRAESWFKGITPGDQIIELGKYPIASLEDFNRFAPAAWKETPDGGNLPMWVEHQGQRVRVEFSKPSSGGGPKPRNDTRFDLLPLELPK